MTQNMIVRNSFSRAWPSTDIRLISPSGKYCLYFQLRVAEKNEEYYNNCLVQARLKYEFFLWYENSTILKDLSNLIVYSFGNIHTNIAGKIRIRNRFEHDIFLNLFISTGRTYNLYSKDNKHWLIDDRYNKILYKVRTKTRKKNTVVVEYN